MQLNTVPFQPSTFTPSTYTPQQNDYSTLQRSMQAREDRANKAYDVYGKLLEVYGEIGNLIPPSEKDWYERYAGKICQNVKDNIEGGNYSSAIGKAYEGISTLRNDKQIVYRRDSYKVYCTEMSYKGSSYNNGKVNKATYDYWLYNNQYNFKPKYDLHGNMNGYEQISVSSLHESINWDDVYNFVISKGRNSQKINDMWDLYFMDGSKLLSLFQEFEVTKFYLDYYLQMIEYESLDNAERANLIVYTENLKKYLYNSDNKPTYEAFVNNVKAVIMANQGKGISIY